MLIASPRHTPADLEAWAAWARLDALMAKTSRLTRLEEIALDALAAFAADGPAYVGVSWGKDSVTVAHLAWRLAQLGGPRLPVVWIRPSLLSNPDNLLVRDAFRARFDVDYTEVDVYCEDLEAEWFVEGLTVATKVFGPRYVSGVRGDESRDRAMRMARWGENTARTCAPIGRWPLEMVYAYLAKHDLPIHPAYACTLNGTLERRGLRVENLYGARGTGFGRHHWEATYYGPELDAIALVSGGERHPWVRPTTATRSDAALAWRRAEQERVEALILEEHDHG